MSLVAFIITIFPANTYNATRHMNESFYRINLKPAQINEIIHNWMKLIIKITLIHVALTKQFKYKVRI